jgi:hypothetical protein
MLILVHLEVVLILMQGRCTFCVKCTIGSKIVLEHRMELLSVVGLVESHFGPSGDSVSIGTR